jgi:hypothetical protein
MMQLLAKLSTWLRQGNVYAGSIFDDRVLYHIIIALFQEAIVSLSSPLSPLYFNEQPFVWAELEILHSQCIQPYYGRINSQN